MPRRREGLVVTTFRGSGGTSRAPGGHSHSLREQARGQVVVDDVATAQGGDVVVPAPADALIVGDHVVRARGAGDRVVPARSRGLDAERVVVGGAAAAASDHVVPAVAGGQVAGQVVAGRALAADDGVVAAVSGGVAGRREDVPPQLIVAGSAVQQIVTRAANEKVPMEPWNQCEAEAPQCKRPRG